MALKKFDFSLLPQTPGCYLFFDAKKKLLYVGKSVNLRHRVSSYFQKDIDLGPAKSRMIRLIDSFDWIEVRSDAEAFILETNLIKKHLPRFNVLMKDDKNLSYIAILSSPVAELIRTRERPSTSGSIIFWPFPQYTDVNLILQTIRRVFHVRSCKMRFGVQQGKVIITHKAGRSVPCMDYYVGTCPAPCLLTPETLQKHQENIERARLFLAGKQFVVLQELREKMMKYAKDMRFEEAAQMKIEIQELQKLTERQSVRDAIAGDADVFFFFEKYDRFFVSLLEIRAWQLVSAQRYELQDPLEEGVEAVKGAFLLQKYLDNQAFSGRIFCLPKDMPSEEIRRILDQRGFLFVEPKSVAENDLLLFAKNDIFSWANRQELSSIGKKFLTKEAMRSLFTKLGLTPPAWSLSLECYDISHHQWSFTVASKTVVINGKEKPNLYRKYKVKTLTPGKIDDFASLHEVLTRRAEEGFRENNFPSLFVIDGGKGQLSSVIDALQKTAEKYHKEVSNFPPVISLAKREEEVFLPGRSDPVLLERGSPELMILQKARDEAHRFAISFHRKSRSKALVHTILDEIPNIGPTTRKKLLRMAGSVDNIREISPEILSSLVTEKQQQSLREYGIIT